jgi:uncharacterized protein
VARGVKTCLTALVFVAFVSTRAFAQDLPVLTGPVNDFAHLLGPEAAADLDRMIRALQAASGDVVVVATVPSIAPFGSIDDYAVKLFEKAEIGKKNQDNGLLILLAREERRVRVEVGYGLEPFITDGYAGETIREVMLPEFRRGAYDQGLLKGTARIIGKIAEQRGVGLQGLPVVEPPTRPSRRSFPSAGLILLGVFVLVRILSSRGGPRSRCRWGGPWSGWTGGVGGFGGGFGGFGGGFGGGGGGGGGFGGFGGGRSGGGGASGGW